MTKGSKNSCHINIQDLEVDFSLSKIPPPPFPSKLVSKESCRDDDSVFKHISQDLLTEILLRVCPKSLLISTSVCKAWCTIIKDPDFIQQRYDRTTEFVVCRLTLPKRKDRVTPPIVSSCNGLICISGISNIYIHNPTTKELTHLSEVTLGMISSVGFGFDATTNQYKVVQLKANPLIATVYTLGTSMIRRLKHVPSFSGFMCILSTYADGSIYWFVSIGMCRSIICFNVGNEKFRVIQLPEGCLRTGLKQMTESSLVEMESKICFAEHNKVKEILNIWMMKEDSKKEENITWIKKYSIATNNINNLPSSSFITPLCIQNKKIILRLSSSRYFFLCFDVESKTFETIYEPRRNKDHKVHQTVVYKESLFCLKDLVQGSPEDICLDMDGWFD